MMSACGFVWSNRMTENMTWGKFKKAVKDAGIKDDDEIWYIDISFPGKGDAEDGCMYIGKDKKCGVAIH